MKGNYCKGFLVFLVLLFGILHAENGFAAFYNATGTWNFSTSGHWNNCGDPPESPGTEPATITQTGNNATLVGHGIAFTGTVSGTTYTVAAQYPEEGGTTSETLTFTLTSSTSGSGTDGWFWTDGGFSCNGGFGFSIVKQQQTYLISGTVSQLEGVLMTLSGDGSGTTTTDASGNYSFANLTNGNYTITPTKEGYRFEPASRNVTINNGDMTSIDFVANKLAQAMSGIPLLLLED